MNSWTNTARHILENYWGLKNYKKYSFLNIDGPVNLLPEVSYSLFLFIHIIILKRLLGKKESRIGLNFGLVEVKK